MNHFHTEDGGEFIDTDDFTVIRTLSWFALIRYLLIAIASVAACAFVGGVIARWMA
jgi:hypothetical protein